MSANERPVAEVVETYGLDDSDEKLKLEIVGGLWLLLYEAVATGWSRFIGLLRSLPAATKAIFTAIDGGLSLKEE